MRLDFASALLALLLILPSAPVRAQDDEEETAGKRAQRNSPQRTRAQEKRPQRTRPQPVRRRSERDRAVVSQCTGWEESSPCAVYNPIRSNECEARKNAGDLDVHYDFFGKTDCRTNTAARKLSDIDRVVIHNAAGTRRTTSTRSRAGRARPTTRSSATARSTSTSVRSWWPGTRAALPPPTGHQRAVDRDRAEPAQGGGVSCNSLELSKLSQAKREALVRKACTPSDEQYTSVKSLLDAIAARTSVTLDEDHVIGHCEGQNPSNRYAHGDPRAFDWSKIGLSNEKKKELGAKGCDWYID